MGASEFLEASKFRKCGFSLKHALIVHESWVLGTMSEKKSSSEKSNSAIKGKLSKSQVVAMIAKDVDLTRKQVSDVMNSLDSLIERSLRKSGCGQFILPGMLKITTIKKPARKARKGTNSFTGEEVIFKSKPASVAVRIRALKKMKEFAN